MGINSPRPHQMKLLKPTPQSKWLTCALMASGLLALHVNADGPETAPSPNWQLATDDTSITIAIVNDKPAIYELKNPGQGWNWTPVHNEFPLLGHVFVAPGNTAMTPDWKFQDATVDESNGKKLTLRFVSTTPKLELKSVWWARKGPGPVEESMTIANQTGQDLTVSGDDMVSADLAMVADNPVTLWRFNKTPRGGGADAKGFCRTDVGVFIDKLDANKTVESSFGHPGDIGTDADLPFEMYDVGSKHGLYIGYMFGYGNSVTKAAQDPLHLSDRLVLGYGERIPVKKEASFTVPGIFLGTYQGDTDDGSNHMKKWFWNYKIQPFVKDPNEPLIEVCSDQAEGDFDKTVALIQSTDLVGMGVGIYKVDAWYAGDMRFCAPGAFPYPRVDELAKVLHDKHLRLSVWQADFIPEAHLLGRFDKWHFDYYRSDQGGAHPGDYWGYTDFWKKLDDLIAARPGFRWENCMDGGSLKSFDDCMRMSFITTSDSPTPIDFKKALYPNTYMVNALQLKSDCYTHDIFDLRCAMEGCILTGVPDNKEMADEETKEFHLYNAKQAPILRGGGVYHVLPMPNGKDWDGLEYYNTDITKGSLFLFKPTDAGGDAQTIKLKGLDRGKTYTLTFEDRAEQNAKKTGAELMDTGLPVTLTGKRASEIVWFE
jgi:hypothetical protein